MVGYLYRTGGRGRGLTGCRMHDNKYGGIGNMKSNITRPGGDEWPGW